MLSDIDRETAGILTLPEILSEFERHGVAVTRGQQRNKAELLGSLETQEEHIIRAVITAAETKRSANSASRRKRRNNQQHDRRSTKRQHKDPVDENKTHPFLTLPSEEQKKECYRAFLHATSNSALQRLVCVACAREMLSTLGEYCFLDSLNHPERLVPNVPHPAHTLVDSMLLVTEFVTTVEGRKRGWFCGDCLRSLALDRLPPLSLANRMWIGPIPPEISRLTVPEQILVSLYHPRAYVYKLYPKDLWTQSSSNPTLQNGLRGNVTTYELNMPDILEMLKGNLMPRPASLLASTIAVSFIGAGPVPKSWLKKTFRVRRAAVAAALFCLKEKTRHPGYVDLDISQEALDRLPEDDVPIEILAAIQYEPDMEKAKKEAESYMHNETVAGEMPPESQNHGAKSSRTRSHLDPSECNDDHVPDAIPLQYLGAVDTDLSKISTEELLLYGLANPGSSGTSEGGYAVRHGRVPVNEFGHTRNSKKSTAPAQSPQNFSVYAFPCLYPYGEGGIEAEREVPVSIQEHIRHNLHYWDRRFRTHPTWLFVFFSMLQKRQALMSSRIQMRRKDFDRAADLFSTLTRVELAAAAEDEANGRRITDPKILLLRRLVHCAGAKIMGSDASRATYRSEIWSTMLYLMPPSLWLTINPSDLHDPIVQLLVGEDIDMDNFRATVGPDRERRAENVARDPYACAEFFHFLINLILEKLFGIDARGRRKVTTTMGVLGRVSGYYGVVEAQGRGSLHVHMLLWLENAPSADDMPALLLHDDFRQRVAAYVDANVRAHLDGMNEEAIKSTDKDPELSWSRPPNPDSPNFERDCASREWHFVRSLQHHVCKKSTCLVFQSHTQEWVCKRRAPFPLVETTTVSTDGEIFPKRTYGYLNNWNPSILVFVACNNDIKFISNGSDARSIIWYITAYQTKKQQRSHNYSALLAEGLAYHFNSDDYIDDLRERNRLLVFRCLRVLNRQMEQSAQQVMSYLLGYGDRFRSHSYAPLHWSSVAAEILRTWPALKKSGCASTGSGDAQASGPKDTGNVAEVDDTESDRESESGSESSSESGTDDDEDETEQVVLETLPSGVLAFRSQLTDYKLRGPELEQFNFLDFIVDTREDACDPIRDVPNEGTPRGGGRPGAPKHLRSRYLPQHPRAKTHQRILRAAGHNVLPNVVGPYLPRNDDDETFDFYCASMLALLRPWRDVRTLLLPGLSWSISFGSFLLSATRRDLDPISGAQYYYQCKDAAARDRENPSELQSSIPRDNLADDLNELSAAMTFTDPPPQTEEELEERLEKQMNPREREFGSTAVEIACSVGLFKTKPSQSETRINPDAVAATPADLDNITLWCKAMNSDAASRKAPDAPPSLHSASTSDICGSVQTVGRLPSTSGQADLSSGCVVPEPIVEEEVQAIDTSHLTTDQLRAFSIIETHLNDTLANKSPKQLLMQIQGEGGTGKSTVIGCVTKLFKQRNVERKLLRSAYTGIAASIIDGNTLHTLCHLSSRRTEPGQTVLKALRETWRDVEYVIIDEISMVSCDFLCKIETALDKAKQRSGRAIGSASFGGLNVVLTGDFHQFPPVAGGASAALYASSALQERHEAVTGRRIYERFKTVVLLLKQCRTTDATWLEILRHVRHGTCTEEHLKIIRSLILGSGEDGGTNSIDPEWEDAVLVTSRHAVKDAWNKRAVRRHCAKNGKQLFICPAEDTIRNRPLTITERWKAGKKKPRKRSNRGRRTQGNLPDVVELAVGMEVMVTFNVETQLDVANGARGVVEQVILDHREKVQSGGASEEVKLTYPPQCVLVRLYRTKAAQIPGLDPNVVPIVPMERKFDVPGRGGKVRRATRRQLPITAAYAFTDYRSQGQTIKRVIVDIGRPPSGGLTPFNAYVALSRSSGRDTIRLLRDFDDELFKKPPSLMLEAEDRRLVQLNAETKRYWESGVRPWET